LPDPPELEPGSAPEPLLLERRVETGGDAYVDRVTADGGLWTFSTVDASVEGGRWSFGRREPRWQRTGTMAPDALGNLRREIAASGFFASAEDHRPDAPVIHASREVWTAELDGRRHTSTLHARGTTLVAELSALAAALEAALASADP
jgi:hypothetical protein